MSNLLNKLKSLPRIAEAGLNKIVIVDSDQKAVNCQNSIHLAPPDLHGRRNKMKKILVFGRFNEVVCEECGTIYRKM